MLKIRIQVTVSAFLVLLTTLSFQPIFNAQPANSYILKQNILTNDQTFDDFRQNLGKEIKKEIYRVIDQYPKLKQKYARSKEPRNSDEISVKPVEPHFTLFMLGNISDERPVQKCIQDELQLLFTHLSIPPTTLNISNKLPLIFIQGQQPDKEISFIGLDIKSILDPAWQVFTRTLNNTLEKKCNVALSHYKTYQIHGWLPHISLFRINARSIFELEDKESQSKETLLEKIQQILVNYTNKQKQSILGTLSLAKIDLYNGQSRIRSFIANPIEKETQSCHTTASTSSAKHDTETINVKQKNESTILESKEFQEFKKSLKGYVENNDLKKKTAYAYFSEIYYNQLPNNEKKNADSMLKNAGITLDDLKKIANLTPETTQTKKTTESKKTPESKELQTFQGALVAFVYDDPQKKDSYGNILWHTYKKLNSAEQKIADNALKEISVQLSDLKKYE